MRAQAFLTTEVLGRDLDRALDHPNQVRDALRRYPIREVTTPVPVEGGVAGGALPMSAGSSFHGRRKPNGSACHRRIMAGVQDAAKHALLQRLDPNPDGVGGLADSIRR
jgi:hypothetical protein